MTGKAVGLLAVAGAAIVALFWPKSASAAPAVQPQLPPGPSASDVQGYNEAQTLKSWIDAAVQSNDPAKMHATASKIRSTHWTHPEIAKAAATEANNLDAYASSIEDYNAAQTAPTHGYQIDPNSPAGPYANNPADTSDNPFQLPDVPGMNALMNG